MQYANVYIDRKLSRPTKLTYKIPASLLADIKIGSLVDVPIRGKITRAVIANFSSRNPGNFTVQDIKKVRSTGSVITRKHLDFYQDFAQTTLSSLEDVIFYFLPPKIKLADINLEEHAKSKKRGQLKFIQGTTKERFDRYRKLVETLSTSLIFIFPDTIALNSFAQLIIDHKPLIVSGDNTPKKRWNIWNISQSERVILLTTRAGIGLIPNVSYILIIDNPTHPGHKEDRRPKFQVEEIIPLRLKLGDKIILGTNSINLLEMELYRLKPKFRDIKTQLTTGQTIDSELIETKIQNKNRTLVAIPKKGEWGLLICKKCSNILTHQKCQKPLRQISGNNLVCSNCKIKINGYPACSNCASHEYSGYSIGANQIEKEFLKNIPNKHVIRLDKDSEINKADIRDNSITIATHTILDRYIDKFDYIICLGFDPLLDILKIDQDEKVLLDLYNFLQLGDYGEILTKRPEHRVYHAIASNTVGELMIKLKQERKDNLPPKTRLVEIQSPKIFNQDLLKEIAEISLIPNKINIKDNNNTILASIPRDKWDKFYKIYLDNPKNISFDPDPRG